MQIWGADGLQMGGGRSSVESCAPWLGGLLTPSNMRAMLLRAQLPETAWRGDGKRKAHSSGSHS
eukprot:7313522-Alexandrium_andersonii.AAC.1